MKNNILKLIKSKGLILIFILIITLPLFQNYTQLFNDKLINEKRNQPANPTYNKKEPISKYFNEKEKYFGDTFGFRDYFIRLSNYTDVNLFNKSPSKGVVIGKNDYLYSSEDLNDYNRTNTLSDEEINKIANNIIILQNNLKNIGINFIFTVAPNKSTIYPEYMKTSPINPNEKSNLEKLEIVIAEKSINYIDYKKLMLENKDKYALYYKRDTHWNTIAAKLAADELIKTISSFYDLGEFSVKPTDIKENFRQGDLDNLLGIKTPILENSATQDIKFSKNKIPKTLVYHDSFYYDVLPMLDDFFVQRIDLHNLNSPFPVTFDQFSQNSELVVFEIVERYVRNLLTYDFNIFNDDISEIKDCSSTSLSLDIKNDNNKTDSKDIAFYPYTDYYGFSSKSNEASITWDVDNKKTSYVLLEFKNPLKYENLSLTFADINGDFKEEQIENFSIRPEKTTYLIEIKNPIEISKLKLNFGNKSNVDLNLKEIKIINGGNL